MKTMLIGSLMFAFSQTGIAFNKQAPDFRACRFRSARVEFKKGNLTVVQGLGPKISGTVTLIKEEMEPVLDDLKHVGDAPVYFYDAGSLEAIVHLGDIYSKGTVFDTKQKLVEINDPAAGSGIAGYCYTY